MLFRTFACHGFSGGFLRWASFTANRGEALGGTGPFRCNAHRTRSSVYTGVQYLGVYPGVYQRCIRRGTPAPPSAVWQKAEKRLPWPPSPRPSWDFCSKRLFFSSRSTSSINQLGHQQVSQVRSGQVSQVIRATWQNTRTGELLLDRIRAR